MPDTLYQIGNFLYDKDMVAKIYFVMLILIMLSFVHETCNLQVHLSRHCATFYPLICKKKSTAAILPTVQPLLPTSNHIPNQK